MNINTNYVQMIFSIVLAGLCSFQILNNPGGDNTLYWSTLTAFAGLYLPSPIKK